MTDTIDRCPYCGAPRTKGGPCPYCYSLALPPAPVPAPAVDEPELGELEVGRAAIRRARLRKAAAKVARILNTVGGSK